jgi:MFS family permease
VDRYAKRRVLLATQAGLGLVSATLGAAVLTGDIRLWQVVVLAVLFGIFSAVDNPARQAFQEVVGRDLIRNAVTLNTTTVNVARVIGPAIAAVLAATVGIGWCFVVNAASFVFVIASLLSLDPGKLYSWLLGALGAGAVVGGLYAARSARTGVARLTQAALGYAVAVGLLAAAPTLATAVAACALAGPRRSGT